VYVCLYNLLQVTLRYYNALFQFFHKLKCSLKVYILWEKYASHESQIKAVLVMVLGDFCRQIVAKIINTFSGKKYMP
jgi:hypothetical protein